MIQVQLINADEISIDEKKCVSLHLRQICLSLSFLSRRMTRDRGENNSVDQFFHLQK